MNSLLRTSLAIASTACALWTHAQSWCPPGAEWTFDLGSDVATQTGVVRAEYDGDTTIAGSSAQRLRQWAHVHETGQNGYTTWSYGDLFTRSTNDLVEIYDPTTEVFDTLMWFAAQPGQHWTSTIYGGSAEQTIIVEEISTVIISGTPLRQLIVSGNPALWSGADTLIERIGYHTLYIRFEQTLSKDGGARNLYCYHDDELSYSTVPLSECGFTVGVKTNGPVHTPTLFPNPGTDHFSMSLAPGTHVITLFDALGHQVIQQRSSSGQFTMDTHQLPSGIYTVRGDDGSPPVRWVKE